jgi:multisubunit Na+/H+ antiporter MnhB subunit
VKRWRNYLFVAFAIVLVCLISFMFLIAVAEMPPYGGRDNPTINEVWERYVWKGPAESGGLNMVTNIILDYRGYDTLLETTVLFTAVMAIMLTLGAGKNQKE